ncbi:hypothetical protein [Streptomyces sp. 8K308]|uniref:hypothetical protein n=1 Tax=Streptomyces sp. 8K308 TaxID=2530388 RepID=UPI001FB7F6FE|nr:hypothetical protein [Streptomyces sp. 8K308]
MEIGRAGAERTIEHLRRRIQELEKEDADEATPVTDGGGDQIVEVNGYAYRWTGQPPLCVGDQVLLPENYVSRFKHGPGPFTGTVTGLGSTYQGELASILRRLPAGATDDD